MARCKAPADKRFKRGRVKTPRKAAGRWTALVAAAREVVAGGR